MKNPIAIRISGIGGQGNILMGLTLAKAAVYDGKEVVQTQSYSEQVRGGISYCDVLIGESPIDYPKAELFDIMYFMHSLPFLEYHKLLKSNGVIFIDSTSVKEIPNVVRRITKKILTLPVTELSIKKFGTAVVANMVGLGAMVKTCGLVSIKSVKKALKDLVKKSYIDMNIKAVEYGYTLVQKEYRIKQNFYSSKRLTTNFE